MKTKDFLLSALLLASFVFGFTSCSDDDDKGYKPPYTPNNGAFILNTGYVKNSAMLSYYDINNGTLSADIFPTLNGKPLGDIGQCIIAYGSKMYISVQGSGVVFVTDKTGKIISEVTKGKDVPFSPKMMAAYEGKVYVGSYNEGSLERIDTTTLTIDKSIAIGPNPEDVKVYNGKVYVATTGSYPDYNRTISVVNPALTNVEYIDVALNPNILKTDSEGNLFLLSWGNAWAATPVSSSLQVIDKQTGEAIELLSIDNCDNMVVIGRNIYLVIKTYSPTTSKIICYNTVTGKKTEDSFIKDGTVIADISAIAIEPSSNDIYVAASNGSNNNGDLYIFSQDGKLKKKVDTGGVFPYRSSICFVK